VGTAEGGCPHVVRSLKTGTPVPTGAVIRVGCQMALRPTDADTITIARAMKSCRLGGMAAWEQFSATCPLSEKEVPRGSCCFTISSIGLGLWMLGLRISPPQLALVFSEGLANSLVRRQPASGNSEGPQTAYCKTCRLQLQGSNPELNQPFLTRILRLSPRKLFRIRC
jgi:hypothetical protein